jgi:hypothetical protein
VIAFFNISLSRNLAIFLGLITPILETIRRWHTWQDDPLSFFDDYILGALLLFGAWRVTKDSRTGQKFLVAGWGFALGLVYASLDHQLQMLRTGAADPAPISSGAVAMVKAIGFIIVVVGLVSGLRRISLES